MASTETFTIGGDMTVQRMGFGAMRITGSGVWGWPNDRAKARALLHRVVELGIDFIDTADAYGPETSEYLLAEALHPYDGVVIATKGGLVRGGPGVWERDGRPAHLRRALENSLRRLQVERIDLYQYHAVDPAVPLEDSVGELARLKEEGKIRHIGLSNVSVAQIETTQAITPVATVQNRFNLINRTDQPVVDYCTEHGIGYIPWFPLATGNLTQRDGGVIDRIARAHEASHGQIALAWLLHLSPVMLPIPGTSSIAHLEENTAARTIALSAEEIAELSALAS
ncbi:MAG: aldo/keto reductase [Myxococcota bacterium]